MPALIEIVPGVAIVGSAVIYGTDVPALSGLTSCPRRNEWATSIASPTAAWPRSASPAPPSSW